MKPTELMLGDWVKCGRRFMQITWLAEDLYCDDIEPVPLTPEILEKNGFENVGDDMYQLEEKPCLFWVDFDSHEYGCEYDTSICEYEDCENRLKLYGIPYVHELQHALKLCGIKKEIKL